MDDAMGNSVALESADSSPDTNHYAVTEPARIRVVTPADDGPCDVRCEGDSPNEQPSTPGCSATDPRDVATTDRAPADAINGAESPHEPVEETGPVLTLNSAVQPEPIQVVEALLFASDTPLSLARLAELVGRCTQSEVHSWLDALNEKYAAAALSFRIEPIARGYQMMTLPTFRPWLSRLDKQRSHSRLSDAALEVLAVIAYKQPIIRADIEAIRGVACGEVLNRLREMGLIKIAGRAEIVGRPILYGTTRKFLDLFGLEDLEDLPPIEALTLKRPPVAPTEPAVPPDPAPRAAAGA